MRPRVIDMDHVESVVDIAEIRREYGLSQAEFADLMGTSLRTVQSWEQGWRKPSPAAERSALLLLMAWRLGGRFGTELCWEHTGCSQADRDRCLAYQSKQGHLCWFLTGNVCRGRRFRNWSDKMSVCEECGFFSGLLREAGLTSKAAGNTGVALPPANERSPS